MNEYYIQDARKLSTVVKTKIDLIITSPPYFDMKDYGPDNQIGFGQKYSDYLNDMREVLNQCYKVTKESASLWMIVDTFKKDGNLKLLPFDLVAEAEKEGWRLQDIIIWKKDKTLPFSRRGEFRNIFEYILYFVKSDDFKFYPERVTELELKEWWVKYPERYSPKGKAKSDVWDFPIPVQGSWGNHYVRHFCPLPSEMIDQIIELSSDENDVVLDPFAGSGAVLSEAHKLNRKYIGCDLSKEFKSMFENYVSTIENNNSKDREVKTKDVFGKTINKLRILKWPSALLKKLRQIDNGQIKKVRGILIESGENMYTYNFVLNSRDKDLEDTILAISKKPPFSKYGLNTEIKFSYNDSNKKPSWEYNWISTHLAPKKFEGTISPFIATDIYLDKLEREMVDRYIATGKIDIA